MPRPTGFVLPTNTPPLPDDGYGGNTANDLVATVEKDVQALQLSYRTSTTAESISGINPFTGAIDGFSSGSRTSKSSGNPPKGSVALSVGNKGAAPAVNEAVLWIYENLKFQLHPISELHSGLVAVAVRVVDRLGTMHQEHLFMQDYRNTLYERCTRLPELRFSSIPGDKLIGGETRAALEDAIFRYSGIGRP